MHVCRLRWSLRVSSLRVLWSRLLPVSWLHWPMDLSSELSNLLNLLTKSGLILRQGFFVCFVFVSYIPKFQSCIPCRKVITRVMYLETYLVSYLPSSNIIYSTEDVHTANTCNNLKCISCFHVSIMFCPAGVGVNLSSHMCSVPYIIHQSFVPSDLSNYFFNL